MWKMNLPHGDVLLVAERLLTFLDGGQRPTDDNDNFVDALDWLHVATRITVLQQRARGLAKATPEDQHTLERRLDSVKHYLHGERSRTGERISTGFVESTINQVVSKRMVKNQQMQLETPSF